MTVKIMRNIIYKSVIFLLITCIFGLCITVTSFAESVNKDLQDEAVDILRDVGIIVGFENGQLELDEKLTRAQFAAVMVRACGYEKYNVEAKTYESVFKDVSPEHWANGYINILQSFQVINGFSDGKFYPDEYITYEQATKIIVMLLGYENYAFKEGGWPEGYMKIAGQEGITKNIFCQPDEDIDRKTAIALVYNAMQTRIFDAVCHYSWVEEYKSDETIFTKCYELNRWEGIVSKDSDGEIILTDCFYTAYEGGVCKKYEKDVLHIDLNPVSEYEDLFGKRVVAYIDFVENKETEKHTVRAIHILN